MMEQVSFSRVIDERAIRTVAALAAEIWREHYTPIIGRAQVEYMLTHIQSKDAIAAAIREKGALYYLIRADGKDIGYLSVLTKEGEKELFLSKLYVLAGERGKGCGREALAFAESIAKEKGLEAMTLTVNKENYVSIKAYRRFGFVVIGPVMTEIGGGFFMDDYRMKKTVRQEAKE